MLIVPDLERLIGIEFYATNSSGIGGVIKSIPKDFVVEESLVTGSKAKIDNPCFNFKQEFNRKGNLLCVLVKKNWDMFSALRVIAKQLNINPNQIQIAGIKDAKALTSQHITIKNLDANNLSTIDIKNIKLYPIGYFVDEFSSYFLLGNNFRIIIQKIAFSKSEIIKRINKILHEINLLGGIPNFYGHQRFGTRRPITHLVGKAMIKGDFEKAAMIFLAQPSKFEHPQSREAREELMNSKDFKKALKIFPRQLRFEIYMLNHLVKKPDDYIGAFRKLPLKLRKLFPQAYQSYLFNKFLSKRIEKGLKLNKAEIGDYCVPVERTGLPMLNAPRITNSKNICEINNNIQNGKMQVAISLIGSKTLSLRGLQSEIEREILENEGIGKNHLRLNFMPEIRLNKLLRTTLTPLNNFSIGEFVDVTEQLEKIQNNICLSFMLYRGSYATVFLREIIKPADVIKAGF